MEKNQTLLIVSKDLFIEAWKSVPDLHKNPHHPKSEKGYQFHELDLFADKFAAFHKRLQSQLDP